MSLKNIALCVTLSASGLSFVNASAQDLSATAQGQKANSPGGINRLQSPDGPEVETGLNGSSELTGVLVDRTLTVIGQNFYRAFSQIAMGRPIIDGATLTVHERPDARWGIKVWISTANRVYFRTQLSPRLNDVDAIAHRAIDIVEKAVLKHQISSTLNRSADLGAEEL